MLDLASSQIGRRPHEQQGHKDGGGQLRKERLGLQHTPLQTAFSKAAENPGTQCRRVWSETIKDPRTPHDTFCESLYHNLENFIFFSCLNLPTDRP